MIKCGIKIPYFAVIFVRFYIAYFQIQRKVDTWHQTIRDSLSIVGIWYRSWSRNFYWRSFTINNYGSLWATWQIKKTKLTRTCKITIHVVEMPWRVYQQCSPSFVTITPRHQVARPRHEQKKSILIKSVSVIHWTKYNKINKKPLLFNYANNRSGWELKLGSIQALKRMKSRGKMYVSPEVKYKSEM